MQTVLLEALINNRKHKMSRGRESWMWLQVSPFISCVNLYKLLNLSQLQPRLWNGDISPLAPQDLGKDQVKYSNIFTSITGFQQICYPFLTFPIPAYC